MQKPVLDGCSPKTIQNIVKKALHANGKAILAIYPQGFFKGFRSAKDVPLGMALPRVLRDVQVSDVLSWIVLKEWFQASKDTRSILAECFQAANCVVSEPNFEDGLIQWQAFNETEFRDFGDSLRGKPRLGDVEREEVTLLIRLMGWDESEGEFRISMERMTKADPTASANMDTGDTVNSTLHRSATTETKDPLAEALSRHESAHTKLVANGNQIMCAIEALRGIAIENVPLVGLHNLAAQIQCLLDDAAHLSKELRELGIVENTTETLAEIATTLTALRDRSTQISEKLQRIHGIRLELEIIGRMECVDDFPTVELDKIKSQSKELLDQFDLVTVVDENRINSIVEMARPYCLVVMLSDYDSWNHIGQKELVGGLETVRAKLGEQIHHGLLLRKIRRGQLPDVGPSVTEMPPHSESEQEDVVDGDEVRILHSPESDPSVAKNDDEGIEETVTNSAEENTTTIPEASPDSSSQHGQECADDTDWGFYRIGPAEKANMVATAVLKSAPNFDRHLLRDLVWLSVSQDILSLGMYLARALERDAVVPPQYQLPHAAIELLILSRHIKWNVGDITERFRNACSRLSYEPISDDSDYACATALVYIAATLRGSLVAASSGGSVVLQQTNPEQFGFPSLNEYCRTVLSVNDVQPSLDLADLLRVVSNDEWNTEYTRSRKDIESWFATAMHFNIATPEAKKVWLTWLSPKGVLRSVVSAVDDAGEDLNKIRHCEESLLSLDDYALVKTEITKTYQLIAKRKGKEIKSDFAINQIVSRTREFVQIVHAHMALCRRRPGQELSFRDHHANKVRKNLETIRQRVIQELKTSPRVRSSSIVRLGAMLVGGAIQNIAELMAGEVSVTIPDPSAEEVLYVDLLRLPDILSSASSWDSLASPIPNEIQMVLRSYEILNKSWADLLRMFSERKDHLGTLRILQLMRSNQEAHETIARYEIEREQDIKALRDHAKDLKFKSASLVEVAAMDGLLKENERADFLAKLENFSASIADMVDFRSSKEVISEITSIIDQKRAAEADILRAQLTELKLTEPDRTRIAKVLEGGDLNTAHEYLQLISEGSSLPESSDGIEFQVDKVVSTLQSVERYISETNSSKRLRDIERGDAIFDGVKFGLGSQDLMETWVELKRKQKLDGDLIVELFKQVGFTSVEVVNAGRLRTGDTIELKCQAVRDRARCAIPTFGSSAHGTYKVMGIWDNQPVDDILSRASELRQSGPVMVLYFNPVSIVQRRQLAQLARRQLQSLLLIDDVLLSALCLEGQSRVTRLLAYATPFAYAEPYSVTSSIVAPEMFYGRQHEYNSIIDPMGSCYIYGGRQLGKSALLHEVERRFHSVEDGRIVIFIDLATEGVGYGPSEKLWEVISVRLIEERLTDRHLTDPGKITDAIREWLKEDSKRRLILLLDEADRLLEAEVQRQGKNERQFANVGRLKALMDSTERRFKAVFCGLHNVQRSIRDSNHPLAHYGKPICIGPLFDNGEWREARALVERPFNALGYRFEHPDIVTWILSHTNYYPSLIQVFCNQLYSKLSRTSFPPTSAPPYTITRDHVENVLTSVELRNQVRDRFMWTLDLDTCYRVIAYVVALHTIDPPTLADGISVRTIRADSLEYWPAGFAKITTEDGFQVLLEEMVGLGVLRFLQSGNYTLRNHNVAPLLGKLENIENELLSYGTKPAQPTYSSQYFRTASKKEPGKRNPLTITQEDSIRLRENGVTLIFGSSATDCGEILGFLKSSSREDMFFDLGDLISPESFSKRMDESCQRDIEGVSLLFVPPACAWSKLWMEIARESVRAKRSRSAFVRCLFVSDPNQSWRLIDELIGLDEKCRFEKVPSPSEWLPSQVDTLSLGPWSDAFMHQWLDDLQIVNNEEQRMALTRSSGRWPILLSHFYSRYKETRNWAASLQSVEEILASPDSAKMLLDSFGLNIHPVRRVLKSMQGFGEPITQEILCTEFPCHEVVAALVFAERLALVMPEPGDTWRIDPVVSRIISIHCN